MDRSSKRHSPKSPPDPPLTKGGAGGFKEFDEGDPFELTQMYLDIPADEIFYGQMARTFIEEYMRMGWSDDEILGLFHEPFYRGTHDILQKKGEEFVRNLICEVRHG